jgi:hypothetical protein
VDQDGSRPESSKIVDILRFPRPTSTKEVRSFLGLAGFYRRYISDFSRKAAPLNDLLKKDTQFLWRSQQDEAFEELKRDLTSEPVLHHPDYSKRFVICTDASLLGLGAVLQQRDQDGGLYPIAFASRSLTPAEKNYSVPELEALAIVFAVAKWRHHIYGSAFDVESDQQSLKWLMTATAPSRLVRWALLLSEYDITIVYRKGTSNAVADALSRSFAAVSTSKPSRAQDSDVGRERDGLESILRRHQKADNACMDMMKKAEQQKPQETRLKIQDELLWVKGCDEKYRIYVPEAARGPVLDHVHGGNRLSGHQGRDRTLEIARRS